MQYLGGGNRLLAVLGTGDQCIAHYPGDLGVALVAKRISGGAIEAYAENVPAGAPEDAMAKLFSGQLPIRAESLLCRGGQNLT